MATLGELTKTISGAFGFAEQSVVVFVRALREDGLLTTGARGVNAPQVQPMDGARLIIALLTTNKPKDAPAAVRDFGKLIRVKEKITGSAQSFMPFELERGVLSLFENDLATVLRSRATGEARRRPMIDISITAVVTEIKCRIETIFFEFNYGHKALIEEIDEGERPLKLLTSIYGSKRSVTYKIGSDVIDLVSTCFRERS